MDQDDATWARRMLHETVDTLEPPATHVPSARSPHRRRIAAAVAICAVVFAVIGGFAFTRGSGPPRTGVPAATTEPVSTIPDTGVTTGSYAPNEITWAYRGSLMLEGHDTIDAKAYAAWAAAHDVAPSETGVAPLWSGTIGGADVFVFEQGTSASGGSPTAFVGTYVDDGNGGALISDQRPDAGISALSETMVIGGGVYTLVLGPSGTTVATSATSQQVVSAGNGWKVYRSRDVAPGAASFRVRSCATCPATRPQDLSSSR